MTHKIKIAIIIVLLFINPIIALGQHSNLIAQTQRTILPQSRITSNVGCTIKIKEFQNIYFFEIPDNESLGSIDRFYQALAILNQGNEGTPLELDQNDILGCSIVTGRISFSYLSVFLFYVLSWLSIASGAISMFFIIVGGYKYIIGGLTEKQDEGKSTIINALIGLLVSTGAWMIVSIVQSFVSR